ncbi:MAG: prepilin-type N-terminal cleavage/methylation domain-containing protein [Gammaproteobacteria bacterium]|nr:prepilin-type N-terminal cleavage/methylation domain-containing protein [Gammaproteobacteria bacterium]
MMFIKQHGLTLIELVISIVIISISLTGVLLIMNRTAVVSADPMIRSQVAAIAQSYMEEILLNAYTDPSQTETGGAEAGETRSTYDDVTDYHNLLNNGCTAVSAICPLGACICNQNGIPVDKLKNYSIQISVTQDDMSFASKATVTAKRIDITTSHISGISTTLSAYKAATP